MAVPRARTPRWGGYLLPGQRPPTMGQRETELTRSIYEITERLVAKNHHDIYLGESRPRADLDKSSGILFVPRDPHQVRSLAETGAYFELNLDPEELIVGLNDPVSKPEHTIDSFEADDVHKLCLCCNDALNYFCKYREERRKFDASNGRKRVLFHLPNTVVHHANLFSLQSHARVDKCHICLILLEKIDNRWDLDLYDWGDYRLEMAFPQYGKPSTHETDFLSFVMVRSDQKKYPVWNWTPLLRLLLWPEDEFRHHFEAPCCEDMTRSEEDESGSPQADLSAVLPSPEQLAVSWLEKCMGNEAGKHAPCKRQNYGYLPTRLLDVRHAIQTSKLRIICPQDDPPEFDIDTKYATLSHCWGAWGAAENPNLTTANLEVRKNEGLSLNSLPKTFRDAVVVASSLKIPYLWIDSLCILQDLHSDWIYEASLMHHTYQFCTVNISASSGPDSQSGLFVHRDPISLTLQRFRAPKIGSSWYVTSDDIFEWSATSPAFSRAWIHRERQIAPRILHFTSEGMVVWECCGTDGASFASETLPGGAPFKRLWNGDTKYQTPYLILEAKKGAEAAYAIWNGMCEKFSTKRLTVKSDMPIILSSLAEEFQKLLPDDEYIAGMWRNSLPQELAWRTKRYWPEGDTSNIAPSWSWLSAPAPTGVKFRSWDWTHHDIALARLNDVEIVRAEGHENNNFGPVRSGTLRLEGFLRKIWFRFYTDGKFNLYVVDTLVDGDEDDDSESRLRSIGRSWDEDQGEICEVAFDFRIDDEDEWFDCWCMFTSIEEWIGNNCEDQYRRITAILLDRSGEADDGHWSRIGTMRMKDIFALKMRYHRSPTPVSDAEQEASKEYGKQDAIVEAGVDYDDLQQISQLMDGLPATLNDQYVSIKENDGSDDVIQQPSSVEDSTQNNETPTIVQASAQEHDNSRQPQNPGSVLVQAPISEVDASMDSAHKPDTNTSTDTSQDQGPSSLLSETGKTGSPSYDDLWDSLATFIKNCRFEVHQREKAERDKNRKAERKEEKADKKRRERDLKRKAKSDEAEDQCDTKSVKEEEEEEAQIDMKDKEATDGDITDDRTLTADYHQHSSIIQETFNDIDPHVDSDTEATNPSQPPHTVPPTLNTTTSNDQSSVLPFHPHSPSLNSSSSMSSSRSSSTQPDTSTDQIPPIPKDVEWAAILDSSTEPPIYGSKTLSPEEALYQFDSVLVRMQDCGYMDWLRRLDVRVIEIK